MSDGTDVLRAIDQLRRDLSGYHGQLVAHNELQRHCDNQRERIVELEGLYAKAKAERDETAMSFCKEHDRAELLMRENAKLRELVTLDWEWAHSCCGNNCKMQTDGCGYGIDRECNYEREIYDRMRELGTEVEA